MTDEKARDRCCDYVMLGCPKGVFGLEIVLVPLAEIGRVTELSGKVVVPGKCFDVLE